MGEENKNTRRHSLVSRTVVKQLVIGIVSNVIAHDIFREGKAKEKAVGTGIKLWEDRRGGQTKGGQQ